MTRNNQNYQTSPAASDTAQWFCITTNPNCQARAALGLYELGFRTFLPKIRKWATHARVRKAVEKPLLGRYMFVEVDQPRQSFWQGQSGQRGRGVRFQPAGSRGDSVALR
jgi:hypothetical protein